MQYELKGLILVRYHHQTHSQQARRCDYDSFSQLPIRSRLEQVSHLQDEVRYQADTVQYSSDVSGLNQCLTVSEPVFVEM